MGKIPSLDEINAGVTPVEYNVVIAPEVLEDKIGSILLVAKTKETEDAASMRGRLIAVSPLAFNYDQWPDENMKPKVGDVVLFAKYAGVLTKGIDEKEVRVMKDRDVMAILKDEQ